MGQKKKAPKADVSFELSRMMVPRDFLEYFEINEVKELSSVTLWEDIMACMRNQTIEIHDLEHLLDEYKQLRY